MLGKILFVAGAATGYVFGSKAGRSAYENLKAKADKLWNSDRVQTGIRDTKTRVAEKAPELRKKAEGALRGRTGHDASGSGTSGSGVSVATSGSGVSGASSGSGVSGAGTSGSTSTSGAGTSPSGMDTAAAAGGSGSSGSSGSGGTTGSGGSDGSGNAGKPGL